MEQLIKLLPLLAPIMLLQLGLQIYSLINLSKRKKVKFDNKWVWALIIIVGGIIGPSIYLLMKGADE